MTQLEYQDYIAHHQLPHIWCPGCGNGIVLRAYAQALAELGLAPREVVTVTGIGCWGKADDYLVTHGLHGTHGRALAFATGVQVANPELTVGVLMGDGDAVTIGGNHFIHAARRNINLVAIVVNNFNYGMTGGQYSATTPLKSKTVTSIQGTAEPGFDIGDLAIAAGANYVARTTVYHVVAMKRLIKEAIEHPGFSLVEVITPCPTYYGRYNVDADPVKMLDALRKQAVNTRRYEKMSAEEQAAHFPIGVLAQGDRPDFLTLYREINDPDQAKEG